jgi:hypothetical protein
MRRRRRSQFTVRVREIVRVAPEEVAVTVIA